LKEQSKQAYYQITLKRHPWQGQPLLYKDQKIGKYQIIRCLGTGGFGSVYLANDVLLNRKVALKIPHYQDQVNRQELLLEPRIMASLRHPNIVELITVEQGGDAFFMVMEYVDGESLDKLIRRNQTLSPITAANIAIDICTAIDCAHINQVIHQDLRPANILITKDGVAKVTDFGTSRVIELQKNELSNKIISDQIHTAAERFRGQTMFQSDILSIGIILYEMLTGMLPFYKKDIAKYTKSSQNKQIIPPHIRQAVIPKELSNVVMKIFSTNMSERYISAKELLKALRIVREVIAKVEIGKVNKILMRPNHNKNNHTIAKEFLCRFCYRPLPRLAVNCPICGEVNQ
jgi:serine/threonine-protein kinase